MNKVLIIGSTGILGSNLTSRLIDDGYSITGVTRSEGFDIGNSKNFESLAYDFDCVINLAAMIQISEDNIEEAVRTNSLGPLNAAKFAKRSNALFFNISTISALPCCNNDYCKSYYAISKRLGDDLVINYCRDNNLDYSILRFSQLYDTVHKAEKYQPMLYRIIKQAKHQKQVTLYGNNNPLRNYLHIEDATKAISIALSKKKTGIWNCIHPSSDSVLDIVKTIEKTMSITVEILRLKDKSNLNDIKLPDQNLFHQSNPEWQPRPLATGLKEIIDRA